MVSHFARDYGTALNKALVPGGVFPFPKSLYAVEDALRIAVKDERHALVVDFFGGSGTTTHAVARLNRQDGGYRRSILVTNNEVSAAESEELAARGLHPGDLEWEALGIFEHMTRPRISAAITGRTAAGEPVQGDYKFSDEFPMADGFTENVEFLQLEYLDRDEVSLGRAFEAVAPLLWLKAGGVGPRVEAIAKPWALPDYGVYGVLFDPQEWASFVRAAQDREGEVRHAFVVTDSTSVFQQVVSELPPGIGATMLYEDYLTTFSINTGGRG
jgi:adenine-specific DNA-methyltransferase